MGLERVLTSLYGSTPRIDLDKRIGQVRVIAPVTFDFASLADGLRRSNVGALGATIEATVEIKDGRVRFYPTGQTIRLEGPAPADSGRARRKMRVHDGEAFFKEPHGDPSLEILP